MSELSNSLEKVSAVTTGAAVCSGLGLLLSRYNTVYPYVENKFTLAAYATVGVGLFSHMWYSFRK
tara:strand:+ start:191 stop:385 length:195 start_codon:yes stop_codon:yes gene_type:complete